MVTRMASATARRSTADTDTVHKTWECAGCGERFAPRDALEHLITEYKKYREDFGPQGIRTELDELGHVVVHGLDELFPLVGLTWEEIEVDPAVQRRINQRHPLFAESLEFDPKKTEAITVVAVYDANGKLRGYRATEGQHRTLRGRKAMPKVRQVCKIIFVETQAEEAAVGYEISASREKYNMFDTWNALYTAGNPNVQAAAKYLAHAEYELTSNNVPKGIAAVNTLFRIIGISPGVTVTAWKTPQEGIRDLESALKVVNGMPAERPGELGRDAKSPRYATSLLEPIRKIIERNPHIVIEDFAKKVSGLSPAGWVEYRARPVGSMSGAKYLEAQLVDAYNKGRAAESAKRIS
jgi:hypothetical protein